MDTHLRDEDEQVAAVKQWWKENGTSLLVGLALALTAIFGWRAWQSQQAIEREEASARFQQLNSAVLVARQSDSPLAVPGIEDNSESSGERSEAHERALVLAKDLIEKHPDSFYSVLGRLSRAQLAVLSDSAGEAVEELRSLSDAVEDPALRAIIQARLARSLMMAGKQAEALEALKPLPDATFGWYFKDLEGDILKSQSQFEQARAAYEQALELAREAETDTTLIEMKLDDLAGA